MNFLVTFQVGDIQIKYEDDSEENFEPEKLSETLKKMVQISDQIWWFLCDQKSGHKNPLSGHFKSRLVDKCDQIFYN